MLEMPLLLLENGRSHAWLPSQPGPGFITFFAFLTNSCSVVIVVGPVTSIGVKRSDDTICSSSLAAAVSLLLKDLWYDNEGSFFTRNLSLMSAFNLLKMEMLLPLTLVVTLMGKWNFSIALLTSLATGFRWKLTFFDGSTWWKNVFGAPTVETKSPCLTSTFSYRSKDALGLTSSLNPIAKSSG
jgi:hypothetical protein